ncbi:MAG: chemotaxis protein CheA, partial [Phycisphaerales bacterium]
AAELVEQIILHQVQDAEEALNAVRKSIEQVQEAVQVGTQPAALDQETPADPERLSPSRPSVDDLDDDLLSTWVSNCDCALNDLESQVVELESAEDPQELIAEVRRGIHTLKGEAGVLSLPSTQKLCHEAESAIDRCLDAGRRFPVDEILSLLDWLKEFVSLLATDPAADAPEYDDLLATLQCTGAEVIVDGADSSADRIEPDAAALGQCSEPPSPTIDEPADAQPVDDDPSPEGLGLADATRDEPVEFPDELSADTNLQDFLCEAREHIASAEEALLALEQDFEDVELINTVFRAFHTIKGVAGFMHLEPIVELAHNAEFLLDEARTRSIVLNSSYVDLILQSCDMLCQLLGALEGADPPTKGQLSELVDQIKHASRGEIAATPAARSRSSAPSFAPLGELLVAMHIVSPEEVDQALSRQAQGASRLRDVLIKAGLTDIDVLEADIVNPKSTNGQLVCQMLVELDLVSAEQLSAAIEAKKDSDKRLGQLLDVSPKQLAPALREQRRLDRESSGESEASPAELTTAGPPAASAGTRGSAGQVVERKPSGQAQRRTDPTVKVNMTRMDSLVDMVGELVIAQQMVIQDPTIEGISEQRCQRNLTHVGKIIRNLQEVAMSLRMVTLKGTFQKMARLVRDVAAKAGKTIKLHIEGEETELDRTVVDEIADPLVHMIRNACHHGIETAEKRRAAGKPETGNLTLRVFHQGGSIVIEIEDDGQGLDRDAILKKAIERGLYSPDRKVSDIPDSEIYNLIFLPGFTTAEEVTDISGRGVGMDVVRRNIHALRGKTEIRSMPGAGSTFVLRLPLTMAIIDGMIVRVGSQRYVIPTLSIEQSFQPTPNQLNSVIGRGELVSIRGSLLPVYRLNRIFNLNEGIDDPTESLLVVLESDHSRCCLLVDEIIGQQQVVIKSLGQGLSKVQGVSGGAILGDGRVALILDVRGLVAEATKMAASNWASAALTTTQTKYDYTADANRQFAIRCA